MIKQLMDRIKTVFFLDQDEGSQMSMVKRIREIRHWELANAHKTKKKRVASPKKAGKKPQTKTAKRNKAIREAKSLLDSLSPKEREALLKKILAQKELK